MLDIISLIITTTALGLAKWNPRDPLIVVKYWDSNSIGDKGGHQGGIKFNSDGFL